MPRNRAEAPSQHSEEGLRKLSRRFDMMSQAITAGLNGNNTGRPSPVLREGVDYVVVSRSSDGQTNLSLHANGEWSIRTSEGRPRVIARAIPGENVMAEKILTAYTKILFLDKIFKEMPKLEEEEIQRAVKSAPSAREQRVLAAELLKPYMDAFISSHEVDLMNGLVADLMHAYGPILRVDLPIEA